MPIARVDGRRKIDEAVFADHCHNDDEEVKEERETDPSDRTAGKRAKASTCISHSSFLHENMCFMLERISRPRRRGGQSHFSSGLGKIGTVPDGLALGEFGTVPVDVETGFSGHQAV